MAISNREIEQAQLLNELQKECNRKSEEIELLKEQNRKLCTELTRLEQQYENLMSAEY